MRSLRTVLWAGIGMLSAPTVSREVVHIMWLLWLLRSRLLHSASRTSEAAPPHAVIPPLWSLAILPRAYRLLLWALFVIVAGGCATVKRLRIDPSFTYQSLSTGGVVVGGVTSLVGEGGVTQVWMTNLLRRSIIEERPDIVVQPFVVFRRALGQVAYGELLAYYRFTGEISGRPQGYQARRITGIVGCRDALYHAGAADYDDICHLDRSTDLVRSHQQAETWLEQLSRAAGGDVQYAIFARIERDYIAHGEVECDEILELNCDGVGTTHTTSRNVGISFHIYDLTMGISVWSGYIAKTKENEGDSHVHQGLIISILEGLLGLTPEYPSPPELSELLSQVFEVFAHNLPERVTR